MVRDSKRISSAVISRLLAALWLLGGPRIGSAAGTWSVVPFPNKPGEVSLPAAVAVDAAGNLYVADWGNGGRIQKRDARGDWSVIATYGTGLGQVVDPTSLAVDTKSN